MADASGPHPRAATSPEYDAALSDAQAATLKGVPRGAFVVAGISVGLLFLGWLAFYFLLFMPRGSVG